MNGYDLLCLHVGRGSESEGGKGVGLAESAAQLAEETKRVATTTATQTQGDLLFLVCNDYDSAPFVIVFLDNRIMVHVLSGSEAIVATVMCR